MKFLKGWRTVIFNALVIIVSVMTLAEWRSIVPPEYFPYWGLAIGTLNIILRAVTDTPLGKSEVNADDDEP